MRKLYLLLLLLSLSFICPAQTTIQATYVTNTIYFNTGPTFVTFGVRNNNTYSIILTGLTVLQADLYRDNEFELWYSTSSLTGPPNLTTANWSLATSSIQKLNTSSFSYVTPFDCIGMVIPPNSSMRFLLKGIKGSCFSGTVTPNIFSANGVDLLVGNNTALGGQVGYFGWINATNTTYSGTAYYFDGSITFAPTTLYNDVQVSNIVFPSTVCNATSSPVGAQICNKSTKNLNLATNNVNVGFTINGPGGTTTASTSLTSGTLTPCSCTTAVVNTNLSAQGGYTVTATSSLVGATDINSTNNSKTDSTRNYKPAVNANTDVCQNSNPNNFAGISSTGCSNSAKKKAIINCTVFNPVPVDGSNDATAGLFATGNLPQLPDGAQIVGGNIYIQHLSAGSPSLCIEARFNIFGNSPYNAANPYHAGLAGNSLSFSLGNFEYKVPIQTAALNLMYANLGVNGQFNIGYWESVNNSIISDISLNAQGYPTTCQIEIEYIISPQSKWYLASSGGSAFYTGANFNPFVLPGSGITNTTNLTSVTYYAACSADTTCRVPTSITIIPSPSVTQDTMQVCSTPGFTSGVFDLTTLTANVSNNNPNVSVDFYQDPGLANLISPSTSYYSGNDFVYSKVTAANGCYSSDSIQLVVHTTPVFQSAPYYVNQCAPAIVDASMEINNFSIPGNDTTYFEDPSYTIPYANANQITTTDTVYVIMKTTTSPSCADSTPIFIAIAPSNGSIANQDTTFDISVCNNVSVYGTNIGLNDSVMINTVDCQRLVQIQDINNNATSLGYTDVEQVITCDIQFHNGQPYLNRHYKITPTNQDSAYVCLYFLENDRLLFNDSANNSGWQLMDPNTNLVISKVSNGDINDPGHTAVVIENNQISASFNPTTDVWTVCFPVDSFSYFYFHTANPFSTPLPINLTSFTAKKIIDQVQLDWIIQEEKNADFIEVERSRDGKRFEIISERIPIAYLQGGLQTNYSWIDKQPYQGKNYYRLRTTDRDNQTSVSKVIDVFMHPEGNITVFPNPADQVLHVELQLQKETDMWFELTDMTGRVVKKLSTSITANHAAVSIPLSDVQIGMYTLRVFNHKGFRHSEVIRVQRN